MKRLQRLIVWTTTLFVISLASGCETLRGNYCAAAQPPFQWRSDEEIDATPARVVAYIEIDAIIWERNKCQSSSRKL